MAEVVFSEGKGVCDVFVVDVLQKIADWHNKNVKLTSGDRFTALKMGAGLKSLHMQHSAADFHVIGVLDVVAFVDICTFAAFQVFDFEQNRYEFLHHGPSTETSGEHLHVGRFPEGKGVSFIIEGYTPQTKGVYQTIGGIGDYFKLSSTPKIQKALQQNTVPSPIRARDSAFSNLCKR